MKKIVYLIDCSLKRGGAPISTMLLAKGVVNKTSDFDVHVIMPKTKIECDLNGVSVHQLEQFTELVPFMLFHPILWIKLCIDIKKIISNINPDIIHCQMPNVGMAIGLLKRLNIISKNIKLIYTDREHVLYLQWYHRIRYNFFIGKIYDAIVVLSEKSKEYWENKNNNIKVQKIYNTAGKEYEKLYNGYEINNPKQLRIMFVGRMVEDKNWELSREIISKLSNVDITVAIAYFDKNQEREVNEYMNSVYKVNNSVKFQLNVDSRQLINMYSESDILVMTSKRESFGRTAVEAMSQKCVVIGTEVGGLPEVIGLEDNIMKSNADDFVNRIEYYNNNFKQLCKDKDWFYKRYKINFSYGQNIINHLELYNEIIGNE